MLSVSMTLLSQASAALRLRPGGSRGQMSSASIVKRFSSQRMVTGRVEVVSGFRLVGCEGTAGWPRESLFSLCFDAKLSADFFST